MRMREGALSAPPPPSLRLAGSALLPAGAGVTGLLATAAVAPAAAAVAAAPPPSAPAAPLVPASPSSSSPSIALPATCSRRMRHHHPPLTPEKRTL